MSCRQVNYANRRKAELITELGSCCWACGAHSPLHIDHPHGRDWSPRKTSFSARIARYWREWLEGRSVRLLCESCNHSRRFDGVVLPFPGATLEAEPADPSVPF